MRQLSTSIWGKGFMVVQIHRKLGLIALVMTIASILTGITLMVPVCNYARNGEDENEEGENEKDEQIPFSCRIANGLGVLIVASSLITGSLII